MQNYMSIKTIVFLASIACGGIFAQLTTPIEWKTVDESPFFWSLSCPELEPGKAKKRDDPHQVELIFMGSNGSKWKAVKWEKLK